MVKILYGIGCEGMGHATRSKAVIEYLVKRGHEIKIVTSGRSYEYLKGYPSDIVNAESWRLAYRGNRIYPWGSVVLNAQKLPKLIKAVVAIKKAIKSWKPDIILNDYAFAVSELGKYYEIPTMTIDNNRIRIAARVEKQIHWWNRFNANAFIWLNTPKSDAHIILTFFYPPLKENAKNTFLAPPIIRKELRELKTTNKDHIILYQTASTNEGVLEAAKAAKAKFRVYGFGEREPEGNLVFKPFSEKEFFDDLSSAKAVITNGGFSLMSECLFLRKPVLSIPMENHYEQQINAYYLAKLGYGMMAQEPSAGVINRFLKNLKRYEKNLKSYNQDPEITLKLIEKKIAELTNSKS